MRNIKQIITDCFYITIVAILFFSCVSNANKQAGEVDGNQGNPVELKKSSLNRSNYELEYPANWYIDSTDEDYDLDTYFSLDSPTEDAFVQFAFFNTRIDEKSFLNKQIEQQLKGTIKNGSVSYFNQWGKYTGEGALIQGKFWGLLKVELKVFLHSTDSSSFLVVSQLMGKDKVNDEKGISLIENSFIRK